MSNYQFDTASLKVLVVDDDENIAGMIGKKSRDVGCDCVEVTNSRLAIDSSSRFNPDLIFLDLCMPGLDGIEVMLQLAESGCRARLVLMSGLKQRVLQSALEVAKSQRLAVVTTLHKPFGTADLGKILGAEIDSHKESLATIEAQPAEALLPGPAMLYEPIAALGKSSDEALTLRAHFTWRADSGENIPFDSLINSDHKAEAVAGLTSLMISRLSSDLCLTTGGSNRQGGYHFYYTVKPSFLIHPDNVSILREILSMNNLNASMFTLEVVEETILANPDMVNETLARLGLQGFRVALVCGQESDELLARIKRLPVDELQVDFAANPLLSSRAQSTEADFWLGSLVSFAHKEGFSVSARNMNSYAHYQLATRCGVDRASGSYFGALQTRINSKPSASNQQVLSI
ncbi:MAG: EAL domain-containing response regulator [Pseudohongiellaceae bacterium]